MHRHLLTEMEKGDVWDAFVKMVLPWRVSNKREQGEVVDQSH
jgi:hypothetical protein